MGIQESMRESLRWADLELRGQAPLYTSEEDAGILQWSGTVTVSVFRDVDEGEQFPDWCMTPDVAFHRRQGDERVDLEVLHADGLLIDLCEVERLADALDARDEDSARFIPLFGGRDRFGTYTLAPEVEDMVEGIGNKAVLVDRVRLATAWRGSGGIGRLLTGRLLKWLSVDANIIALTPFPIDAPRDDDQKQVFDKQMTQVKRVWTALGFEEFTDEIWILDPHKSALNNAISTLEHDLNLNAID